MQSNDPLRWFMLSNAIVLGIVALSSTPALAQCGYGTSQQDCQHQQRDEAARREADQYYRNQAEQTQPGSYENSSSVSGGGAPHRWVTAFAGTAYHPDARDIWAVWDARGSFDHARQLALAACTQAMGTGCLAGAAVQGGSIAAAHDQNGLVWTMHGPTPKAAAAAVQALCRKSDQECVVFRNVTTKHWEEVATSYIFDRTKSAFPSRRTAMARSAAVAWPKDGAKVAQQWQNKVWLVSGIEGVQQARQRVVANCRSATGTECVVGRHVVGTNIIHYRTDKGVNYWSGLLNRAGAGRFIDQVCAPYGDRCQLIASYDANRALEQVVDTAVKAN